MVDGDWARLRAYVIRDRDAAGYDTQRKFAEAIGVSDKSVNNFEAGRNRMRRGTLSRVETVLGWVPGSAQVVLNGGEPSYFSEQSISVEFDRRLVLLDATENEMWDIGIEGKLPEERIWWRIFRRRKRNAEEEAAHGGHNNNSA